MYGVIYLHNSNPPIWYGTPIRLFLVKSFDATEKGKDLDKGREKEAEINSMKLEAKQKEEQVQPELEQVAKESPPSS